MTDGVTRRTAMMALGLAAAGCGATPRATRVGGARTWTPEGPTRGTVVLVHGLGTGPALFDLPGVGGPALEFARAGFAVLAPDLSSTGDLGGWVQRLRGIVGGLPPPVVGIGLDLGGTALYHLRDARGSGMTARVGIGAPIARGGFSPAVRAVLTAPGRPTWNDLGDGRLGPHRLSRLLLTGGLPGRVEGPLRRVAFTAMDPALRRAWLGDAASAAIPTLLPRVVPSAEWGPTLIVTAPGDGLAPPWQCDPRAFDAAWPALTTRSISRVNAHEIEFNHLDLVVHPHAARKVWSPIVDWVQDRVDEVAAG